MVTTSKSGNPKPRRVLSKVWNVQQIRPDMTASDALAAVNLVRHE